MFHGKTVQVVSMQVSFHRVTWLCHAVTWQSEWRDKGQISSQSSVLLSPCQYASCNPVDPSYRETPSPPSPTPPPSFPCLYIVHYTSPIMGTYSNSTQLPVCMALCFRQLLLWHVLHNLHQVKLKSGTSIACFSCITLWLHLNIHN